VLVDFWVDDAGQVLRVEFELDLVTEHTEVVAVGLDSTLSLVEARLVVVVFLDTTGVASTMNLAGNGVFTFGGKGPLTAQTVTWGNYATVNLVLNIAQKLTVNTMQVSLNGLVVIQTGAVMNVAGQSGFWGPADATNPGGIINNGIINIGQPNVTFNNILYSGIGDITLSSTTADFQSMNVTVPGTVKLTDSTAVLKGESLAFSYGNIVGPHAGATLGILRDQDYSTCTSPCGGDHPNYSYQTYWARVQSSSRK